MDVPILLSLLLVLTNLCHASNICTPAKCSLQSPEIRAPFQIQGIHPDHCGRPGFALSCQDNATTIHFPSYGDLAVKSISYGARRLDLIDPKSCVPEVFLNLNMSATPFRYYYDLKEHMYVNCSDKLGGSIVEVPCLSGFGHHVYVVEPSSRVPFSCTVVKAVAIPFSYSPYLSDSSFGLRLTWGPSLGPIRSGEKIGQTGQGKHFQVVAGMMLAIFMVGMLLYASYATICKHNHNVGFISEEMELKKETKGHGMEFVDAVKLMGEYEAI